MTASITRGDRTARRRGPAAVLLSAFHPGTGPRLARLRRTEIRLAGQHPRPTVIAVLGTAPGLGTSGFVALLAQTLHGIAESRVAVLDCDGANQPQRLKLSASPGGDVRRMLTSRSAGRVRRAVDRYLCPDAVVPLFAAAATAARGTALHPAELLAALRLIRRRYPIVVMDVPISLTGDGPLCLVQAADHVVAMIPPGTSPAPIRAWVESVRPGTGVTAICAHGRDVDTDVDVAIPVAGLVGPMPVRLRAAALSLLGAVEAVALAATTSWRPTVAPASVDG